MEPFVDRSIDRSHAGSWHGEARAGKPAAAHMPDEPGVQHAQWGQHAAEAPVANGIERGAAGLCEGPLPPTMVPLRGAWQLRSCRGLAGSGTQGDQSPSLLPLVPMGGAKRWPTSIFQKKTVI
jgi:hypothetical protein